MRFPDDILEERPANVVNDVLTASDPTEIFLLAAKTKQRGGYAVSLKAIKDLAASMDLVQDALASEDIPGQISTAVAAEDIPGQVSSAITLADIPSIVSTGVLSANIPGQISSAITVADIPGQVESQITDADIPGLVDAEVSSRDIPSIVTGEVSMQVDAFDFETLIDTEVASYDIPQLIADAFDSGIPAHTHTPAEVGLPNVDNTSDLGKPISTATQSALDLKSNTGHAHDDRYFTESEVTSLLSGKSDTTHDHDGDYAPLSGGTIPSLYVPPIAITNVHTVANEAAMIALTAEEGDVAIRTDLPATFIHNGGTAGTAADWSQMSAEQLVLSVNGKTGVVSITSSDIGLGNVENKSSSMIREEITVSNIINSAGLAASHLGAYTSAQTQSLISNELSTRVPVFTHEYKTAAFTAAFTEAYRMSGTFTVTLPSANNEGKRILFVNVGTGTITLDAGTDTVNGQLGSTFDLQGGESVIMEGTNTTDWILY